MRRTVRGKDVPAPRFTRWAALYFGLYVGLPILGLGFLLDLALFLLFGRVFDRCYAILCLF